MVDNFLKEIMQAHPKATYGEMMIRSAFDQGAVDTLLLSEALRKKTVFFNCRQCKHEWSFTVDKNPEIPDCFLERFTTGRQLLNRVDRDEIESVCLFFPT